MTIVEERPVVDVAEEVVPSPTDETAPTDAPAAAAEGDENPVSPFTTSLSAFLATAAAGWLAGGLFQGIVPRLVGVLGALIGTGFVALSYKTRRPTVIQYLGTIAPLFVGALLVLPDAGSGSANLPSLVVEAVRGGGIGTPPVPFLPGWRFILIVFIALLGGGGAASAIAFDKAKLGIFLPLPIIFGAALLQPPSAPAAMTAVAVALVPLAITVSHGAQLAHEGSTSNRFEMRRLARSAGVVALMMVALVILSALGLLFPDQAKDRVIPPQRPPSPPPAVDRVIFKVKSDRQVPWRLGVLDGYDGSGWLLPPLDPKRLVKVPSTGDVPVASQTPQPIPNRGTFQATFTITDLQGANTPDLAATMKVGHQGDLQFDPRTQTLRLPTGRVKAGTTYTVTAAEPASGAELIKSSAPAPAMAEYLRVPPGGPPDEVATLLSAAPTTNRYDRLQYVRNAFYQAVVAAGGGKPVDVPPSRVASMLAGKEASPFEITAAEALLARWAGVPSRIGYGYFGGDKTDPSSNELEVRPKNGATWLEAYFEGHGWVPLIGVPAKAKASKNNDVKDNPDVRPSEEVALAAYVPVRVTTVRQLFELVRYWVGRFLPLAFLGLLAFWLFPGLLKLVRRALRRYWAGKRGPIEALVVAYAELRDVAIDLNVGNPYDSPIEFIDLVEYDAEHAELAWLVTRAMWGDLRRGVRPEDAQAATEMAESVAKRLSKAQPAVTRIIAFGSRISLRTPYLDEIPNLWFKPKHRERKSLLKRLWARRKGSGKRLMKRAPRVGASAAVLVAIVFLAVSCGSAPKLVAKPALPLRTVPDRIGDLVFQREPTLESGFDKAGKNALVSGGQIFSIRQGDDVKGSFELASFKPGLIKSNKDLDDVRMGVAKGLGTGNFKAQRVGTDVILAQRQTRTTYYLWFDPNTAYFQFMVAGRDFANADAVFGALLEYQRGGAAALHSANEGQIERIDPRRGGVD